MFEDIMGHETQRNVLKNMIETDRVSHAYLFSGEKGIGKATLAAAFAKVLLHTDHLEACPDFTYISRKEDKKDILIDQIRKDLIDNIYITPATGDKKVYIIDEAEYLNIASQNALLKTLEEPPQYVVIILISSTISTFLPTILSRVNHMGFQGITREEVKNYILKTHQIELKERMLEYIDGSIGTAIQIVNNGLLDHFEKVDKFYKVLESKNAVNCLKDAQDISFTEEYMLDYLEFILYQHQKFEVTKFVEKAKIRLKNNGNYDIVIDNMILKIIDQI